MHKNLAQTLDARTKEFVAKETDKEIYFLELIVFCIVAVCLIRWTGKAVVAAYSRALFINKPGYQKAAWTKDTQHYLPKR